jgi:hypothetical protein
MEDAVPTQSLPVVLDSHRCSFGGTQCVDAEQVGQRAVVHGDGLCDLEEPDQLEPVQALGTCLVLVDLGQPSVDGRVRGDETVDVGEPEEPADAVHHRVDRGRHQTGLAEMADEQLHVRSLDSDQRVEPVRLAPGEPPAQLVGVQMVGVAGVPGQVRDRGELGGEWCWTWHAPGDLASMPQRRIAAHTMRQACLTLAR